MRVKLVALALAVFCAWPARAETGCRLIRIVSLEMEPDPGRIIVPAAIGDRPLRLIVDTGGYVTSLSETTAERLGLKTEISPASSLYIIGGIPLRRFTTISDFRLGKMKAGRLTYPLLPGGFLPPDQDGLLAPDFLANFDVDLDFAGAKVSLFSKDHCEGKVGYWTNEPLTPIPMTMDEGLHIAIHVQLDGQDIKAMLDTGAPHSLVSLEKAQSLFDLRDDDPRFKTVPGPNKTGPAKRFPFKQITFGNVVVSNPEITLASDSAMRLGPQSPPMILGLSILRQLHLYIAYREKNLYLTAADTHR